MDAGNGGMRFQVCDSSAVLTDYKLSVKHPILGEMTNIEFHCAAESNAYEQSQKEGDFWEFVYE